MIRDQLIFATHVRRRTMIAEAELQRYIAGATAVSPTKAATPRSTKPTTGSSRGANVSLDKEKNDEIT
jgi:hypothetical protein